MKEDKILAIDKAIHSRCTGIYLDKILYRVYKASNGCRSLKYNDILFMEQNPKKRRFNGEKFVLSDYAKKAREGNKITWGIRGGKWILVINNKIINK